MQFEKFRIAYWIRDWNIYIMTNERILIYNESLVQKELDFKVEVLHEGCYDFQLLKKSFSQSEGFILGVSMCEEPNRKFFKSEYFTPFVNYDNNASWILRVTLAKDGKLQMIDPANNSIFVWYELPEAILEYANNKMIVSMYPSSFLFIEDWMPIRHLKQDFQNIL